MDASKRKAKPIGMLFWEAGTDGGQGEFSLEVSTRCQESDLPLSLAFCARREGGRATPEESRDWVRSRIVPENRQNIVEVLRANGLAEYSEVDLLAAGKGRSSDDDYLVYEVDLPDKLVSELSVKSVQLNASEPYEQSSDSPASRVDKLLAAIERRRTGVEIHYAYVELPDSSASKSMNANNANDAIASHSEIASLGTGGCNAAQRIGAQIRARRREAGLTQKQLAVRAGISQAVLSRVESGLGNPTLALLEELAFALDVHLEVSLGVLKGRGI